MQSWGEIDNYRYSAPEIQWPEDHDMGHILITKESDVYGMSMIVYEASSHLPVSSSPMVESHLDLLGLDRKGAVLRAQRYRCTVKDTGWGNSQKTLRRS